MIIAKFPPTDYTTPMTQRQNNYDGRYQRQELFALLGQSGQRKLCGATVLIVGAGGLGSWVAELLARAGCGKLRLADDDIVDWSNLARQGMYTEADVAAGKPKALAAAARISQINSNVEVEAITERATSGNIAELATGVDLIIDGTDDWASRFLLNDFAVSSGTPWIFAGVVQAQGHVMAVIPGTSGCLRCIYETPPPRDSELAMKASSLGVLGGAVAAIASMEVVEAMKILSGNADSVSPYLTKLDLWTNRVQQLTISPKPANNCPCCVQRKFEFLNTK
ncbi:MAG: HesA/MoeB/ThiF family protein [Phycisphaerae bacterium]|nr:HesA/MoeB/ThiF family protein [Phycisphaerae bacterium]